jgi:hypothetical protein
MQVFCCEHRSHLALEDVNLEVVVLEHFQCLVLGHLDTLKRKLALYNLHSSHASSSSGHTQTHAHTHTRTHAHTHTRTSDLDISLSCESTLPLSLYLGDVGITRHSRSKVPRP